MIPPGLWAAFSMVDYVLSCLSDAMRTGMCLICALLLKKCLAVCLVLCLASDARRCGRGGSGCEICGRSGCGLLCVGQCPPGGFPITRTGAACTGLAAGA